MRRTLSRRAYSILSAMMAAAFASVGAAFLFFPEGVVRFFNGPSRSLGLPEMPVTDGGFFLALASAYMVVVTAAALGMSRNPGNPAFPRFLALAKISSSLISFGLAAVRGPSLLFLANGVVDGLIGISVLILAAKVRKEPLG